MPTLNELRRRGHSYRNFEPHEVMQLMKEEGRGAGRQFLAFMESGRYETMLDAAHDMYVRLDADEAKTFWRRNPDLMRWVMVWGVSEHLNPATKHKPDDIELYPEGDGPLPSEIPG